MKRSELKQLIKEIILSESTKKEFKVGDKVEWTHYLAPSEYGEIIEIRGKLAKVKLDSGRICDNIRLEVLHHKSSNIEEAND